MKAIVSFSFVFFLIIFNPIHGQSNDSIKNISSINLSNIANNSIQRNWLHLGIDAFNNPIKVPVLIARGSEDGPVLGLTAALHGNELNGIAIIQSVFEKIDITSFKGIIIAIPGLNPAAIFNDKRRFIDSEDLNRVFPGKENGNRSQLMAFKINEKIIKLFDYHIDMHTASFGRINSMYARADMSSDKLSTMAKLQNPDIILSNKGKPSFGSSTSQTMRTTALQQGVFSITVEYGNPQVYQPRIIERGTQGILNLMMWLNMIKGTIEIPDIENICSKSYWMYTKQGGLLELVVDLNQKVKKGAEIGVLKNPFGDIIEHYFAPEDGIIIGKSTNPVNMSGGRIIHLGILKKW